jgi:hypothetical protein
MTSENFLINPILPLQQTISAPQLTNPQHLPHDVTKFFNKSNLTSPTDYQRSATRQPSAPTSWRHKISISYFPSPNMNCRLVASILPIFGSKLTLIWLFLLSLVRKNCIQPFHFLLNSDKPRDSQDKLWIRLKLLNLTIKLLNDLQKRVIYWQPAFRSPANTGIKLVRINNLIKISNSKTPSWNY